MLLYYQAIDIVYYIIHIFSNILRNMILNYQKKNKQNLYNNATRDYDTNKIKFHKFDNSVTYRQFICGLIRLCHIFDK